ncbi:MAG: VOC family protein [Christensenellales bacterium]
MQYTIRHMCITVFDLEKSLKFYEEVLGLQEMKRLVFPDEEKTCVFLTDSMSANLIELMWMKDRKEPYDLGDNLGHIGIRVDDIEAARAQHEKMGIVTMEIDFLGVYFIKDPDGYILEIIPTKK